MQYIYSLRLPLAGSLPCLLEMLCGGVESLFSDVYLSADSCLLDGMSSSE